MCKAGKWNPSFEITFMDRAGGHTHEIGAGHSDVIDVYREGSYTYVLSHHEGLGYFGLEVFDGPEKVGDIFVEAHQFKDVLGRDAPAPFNAIKRLREYIQ